MGLLEHVRGQGTDIERIAQKIDYRAQSRDERLYEEVRSGLRQLGVFENQTTRDYIQIAKRIVGISDKMSSEQRTALPLIQVTTLLDALNEIEWKGDSIATPQERRVHVIRDLQRFMLPQLVTKSGPQDDENKPYELTDLEIIFYVGAMGLASIHTKWLPPATGSAHPLLYIAYSFPQESCDALADVGKALGELTGKRGTPAFERLARWYFG